MARQKRCRHLGTWLIAGGNYEWCYQCGALRDMRECGIASVTPTSPWVYPVGPKKPNPWQLFDARRTAYRKRYADKLHRASQWRQTRSK